MDVEDERFEDAAVLERLKAAIHLTVGEIGDEQGVKNSVTFSKQFVAALTEVTFKQTETMAQDLELFAKHAKRTIVSVEDVKLCARRNDSVVALLERAISKNKATKQEVSDTTKQTKKSKTS